MCLYVLTSVVILSNFDCFIICLWLDINYMFGGAVWVFVSSINIGLLPEISNRLCHKKMLLKLKKKIFVTANRSILFSAVLILPPVYLNTTIKIRCQTWIIFVFRNTFEVQFLYPISESKFAIRNSDSMCWIIVA